MATSGNHPPTSSGLGGDGDEIDAIEEVERRFGVRLDCSDARQWKTAGEVFVALQRTLPAKKANEEHIWRKFAEAISMETGVDPSKITPATRLLGQSHFDWRLVVIMAFVIGLIVALVPSW